MKALIDCRADASLLSALKSHGFEPITIPPADYLQAGIASHTDMLIFIGFDRLFCHTSYYEKNKSLIDSLAACSQLTLTISDEPVGAKYPSDVLFNACLIGNRLICNEKTVSRFILDAAIEKKYEIINVPQGYTKCSICTVSDNAIITADHPIATACKALDINVLEISEGYVALSPYSHGFIGGASGMCGDMVYFCGSLSTHPDAGRIVDFCRAYGKTAISLTDSALIDVGTIFFI